MIRAGLRAVAQMYELTRSLPGVRALVASRMAESLGAGLLHAVLPLLVAARLGVDRLGLVFTIGSLLPMLLQPVLGALSDRLPRRFVLAGASLSGALLIPLFAVLDRPLALAAVLAARILVERSAQPVAAALVGDVASDERRATVLGLLGSASNLLYVAGLLASAAAVRWLGAARVFLVGGALFLVSSVLLLLVAEPRRARAAARASFREVAAALLAPIAYLGRGGAGAALVAHQFFCDFALDLFPIYLPLLVVQLGASPSLVGPIVAVSWLVYGLVQPLGGRLADRAAARRGLITFGLGAMAACVAALGLTAFVPARAALPLAVFAWVAVAVPDGLFRPAAGAVILAAAPAARRGHFLGALGGAGALANVVAPALYGVTARHGGLGAAFFVSAAALGVALAVIRRALPSPAPEVVAAPTPLPKEAP